MKKNNFKLIGFFAVLIMLSVQSMAQNNITKQDLSIFPKPEAGYKMVVIDVPHSDKDDQKKIEFKVGKRMEVDGCNYFNLQGTLESKSLKGWGYNYYTFKTNGQVISTMMGCLDGEKRNLFVSAAPETTRYNGKLPIVIYIPDGYEVHFKVFKAEEENYVAAEVKIK